MSAKASRFLSYDSVMDQFPCTTYHNRFNERYASGVTVTVELAVGQAEDWDWYWAANKLLTSDGRIAFNKASKAADETYENSVTPYQELSNQEFEQNNQKYEAARQEARRAGLGYQGIYEAGNAVWALRDRVASVAYEAAVTEAQKTLNKSLARAFAEIFISEGQDEVPAEPVTEDSVQESMSINWGCRCEFCENRDSYDY